MDSLKSNPAELIIVFSINKPGSLYKGNPAVPEGPVVFRLRLAAGLALMCMKIQKARCKIPLCSGLSGA
jgi:hypothetical protein